jgi:large subunit ribosomal protein L24
MERTSNKQPKLKVRKGDTVKVVSGDSKGAQGRVLEVLVSERRVLVEGVNMVTKHTKPNAKNTQGGIVKQEAPIHISNVMVVDGKGNATRVGRREENGKLVRYSKKSGEVIK